MLSPKKLDEIANLFYEVVREQKWNSFKHGIFVGVMQELTPKRQWKSVKHMLMGDFNKFLYFCSVDDAKAQLEHLFCYGEFQEPHDCHAFKWKGGQLPDEKLALTSSCTFISDAKAKQLGWTSCWMNNPKYNWEWNGTDKYSRNAYDFNYMVCRGTTMGEFYGGNPVD